MHSLDGWLPGHALEAEHRRLAWLFTLRDAHVTTTAFNGFNPGSSLATNLRNIQAALFFVVGII